MNPAALFSGHKTDLKWEDCPFEDYLFIHRGVDGTKEAYGLKDDSPLNLGKLLQAVYPDFTVTTVPESGGSDYAAIITNGRPCNSVLVWNSCNFYLEE